MAKVTIKGREYKVRFTIGFWKKIKQECEVTQENLEAKLKEDFGNISSLIIYWGIQYGINPFPATPPVTKDEIECELDRSVMDVIEEAVIDSMTKEEKRIVELVKNEKEIKIAEAEESFKKKLQSQSTDS